MLRCQYVAQAVLMLSAVICKVLAGKQANYDNFIVCYRYQRLYIISSDLSITNRAQTQHNIDPSCMYVYGG